MKPPLFRYQAPDTLEEAVATLAADPDALVLAGGQSLVPALNFRLAHPSVLVDIQHVGGLNGITVDQDWITVRAMARHREVELDARVTQANPLIPAALAHVAHIPIRNRGTVVGSLSHADAAAEMPMVLVLLGGHVIVQGPGGRRQIAADDFYRFHLTTSRAHDEIVVEARFPVLPASQGWAFDEITRRHGDYAIAGVGAMIGVRADGRAGDVRLAACGVAARPIRLLEAEELLTGTRLGESELKAAGAAAANCVTGSDDLHASKAYRQRVVATLVRRLVPMAANRARASMAV